MTTELLPEYEERRQLHRERRSQLFERPAGEFTVGELHFLMHCTESNVDIKRLQALWMSKAT